MMVLSAAAPGRAAKANPFGEGDVLDKIIHPYFLGEIPKTPDYEKMDVIKGEYKSYALIGKVFYLHTPDGFEK